MQLERTTAQEAAKAAEEAVLYGKGALVSDTDRHESARCAPCPRRHHVSGRPCVRERILAGRALVH